MERVKLQDIDKEIIYDYGTNGERGMSNLLARLYNTTPQAIYDLKKKMECNKESSPIVDVPRFCPFNDIEERDIIRTMYQKLIMDDVLNDKEKAALDYYFNEGHTPFKEHKGLAVILGVSRSRVGQICDKMLPKIRNHCNMILHNKYHVNAIKSYKHRHGCNIRTYVYHIDGGYSIIPYYASKKEVDRNERETKKNISTISTNKHKCPICFNEIDVDNYCRQCGPFRYSPNKSYNVRAGMKSIDYIWEEIWKIARTLPSWSFDCAGNMTYGLDKTGYTFETGIITKYALKSVKTRRKKYCKNT